MSKYRIAWLPGDGIGVEVMDAARIVLDALEFDAEYVHGDIGWEFWCREGDAFPPAHHRPAEERRRRDVRRDHLEAGQGRRGRARARAAGQGPRLPLADRAHAAALRPLRLPAPLQGVPGQPAQLQGRHRPRRLPREHRGPVRRRRVPPGAAGAGGHARPSCRSRSRPSPGSARDEYAVSCKINTRQGSERIVRAAFEFARKHGRKKVTIVHKANVVRATDGLFLEEAKTVAQGVPADRLRRRQHRRDDDVAAQEPVQLRRARGAEPLRRHHLGPVRADGRRPRLRLLRQHRREARGLRADARLGPEVRRASTRPTRSPRSWRPR